MRVATLTALVIFGSGLVLADSVSFDTKVLQDFGNLGFPLGEGLNPLVGPSAPFVNADLVFVTGLPTGVSTILATVDIAGFHLVWNSGAPPFTSDCPSDTHCFVLYGFIMPDLYTPTQGNLTVDINGESRSFDFRFQTPVPEPSSIEMFIFGSIVLVGIRIRTAARRVIS